MKPRLTSHLVALSSAAVLGVYTAGYMRTRAAAARIASAAERPRPVIAAPAVAGEPVVGVPQEVSPVQAAPPPARPASGAKPQAQSRAAARPKRAVPLPSQAATPAPAPTPITPVPVPLAADDPKPPAASAAVGPAPATPTPAAGSAATPAAPVYKDGTYTGWGTSRHGDIQATVVIEGGKILSATISQCLTRYSCSVIEKLPPQVAARQSPEVDYVSGATQSTNAFYYAVVEALSKAK